MELIYTQISCIDQRTFDFLILIQFQLSGCTSLGSSEKPSGYELRQIESIPSLLLRERNYAKGLLVASTAVIVLTPIAVFLGFW